MIGQSMKTGIVVAACMAVLTLAGCMPGFRLVPAEETFVAGKDLVVTPGVAWNMAPMRFDQTDWEETWTRNGPLLETITFVGGLPEGKALLRQKKKSDRQVPPFRADMTPQDLVSMIETSYRTRGVAVFDIDSVDPVDFLDGKGLNVRFRYAPNNGISKKGSCVMRVVGKKLYALKLEGVASHYFDAALPEFERMVATAHLQN
jgi:hypothetical protein